MALGTFISGRYSSTYDAVDTGIADGDEAYSLEQTSKAEVLDSTDAHGMSTIDWVYRGGDAFVQWISKEYKAGSLGAYWPYGATVGTISTTAAPIGRLASDIASALVLTATANTPAATAPASLTASLALLAPNYNARLLFNSKLRPVPIRLQLIPSLNTGTLTWFVMT